MKKTNQSSFLSLAIVFGILVSSANSKAETLSIYDDSFSIFIGTVQVNTKLLSGRWGVWSDASSSFTQLVTSTANKGYVDTAVGAPELSIEINQTSNTNYAIGTALALAIFTDNSADAQALNYTSSIAASAIFTNPSWTVPTFNNNATYINWALDIGTVAKLGQFNFNGGNQVITLVPEPSSASLLLIGTAIALGASRRRLGAKTV